MLLLTSKTTLIVVITGIFVLQWALATFAVYLLLKDRGIKKGIVAWNIFIMLAIIIGPLTYFIVRSLKNNKQTPKD